MSNHLKSTQNSTTAEGSGSATIVNALDISIIVFMSIALYNALELAVLIPISFRHYRSLYFWSLLTSATLGVIPDSIAGGLQFFNLQPLWLSVVLQNVAFILMVPNQSVVLYSRLHLVSQNTAILRFIRWLIILAFGGIVAPTVVLHVGWAYKPHSPSWSHGFPIMERIQVTWFTIQECFISAVYIWETIRLINLIPNDEKRTRKILYELLGVNVIFIVMDLALVVLQYLNYYFTQMILKATVYSVKLKLEFAVLGMLVSILHRGESERTYWRTDRTITNFS